MQWKLQEVTCNWADDDRLDGVGVVDVGWGYSVDFSELCTASGRSCGHGETNWGWDRSLASPADPLSPPAVVYPAAPNSQAAPKLITAATNRQEKK